MRFRTVVLTLAPAWAWAQDSTPPTWPAEASLLVVESAPPPGAIEREHRLTWTPAVDDSGVTGYAVYRGDSVVARTQKTSWNAVLPPVRIEWRVEARDAAGNWSTDGPRAVSNATSILRVLSAGAPTTDQIRDDPATHDALEAAFAGIEEREPSRCYGRVDAGRLENGWPLPEEGANFQPYSTLARGLGRTYVHSEVLQIVVDSYAELARTHPKLRFVYGETGLVHGGPFEPHRTHQTGTSVDFMVPVRDATGVAVLPTNVSNNWGYAIDFDKTGRWGSLTIDFEAVAAHLASLKRQAAKRGIKLKKVIFAPELQKRLRRTKAWAEIADLPFTKRTAWVRHDDHYHVDFGVPCATE